MAAPSVRVHPDVVAEARAAYGSYAERNASAANAFMAELLHGRRKFLLRRFPYGVIYRITERELQVIAVAHGRRRPGYWRTRRF